MRIMCALAVFLVSQSLLGCQGISPTVEQAQLEMDRSVNRLAKNHTSLLAAYLRDVGAAWRAIAADNARAALKADGAEPDKVVDKLLDDLAKIRAKTAEIAAQSKNNARNVSDYRALSEGVRGVIRALVERKPAEDALRAKTAEAAAAAAKRGGGF